MVPIVESQPILHVKAQSKHAPNHQVSSDYVVCHSISTRVLDYHTRPPTKGSVMNHPVSQFPPLAPNLVTVSNYKQPKAGVSHLVSQPPPDPSHLDVVSTMEIFSTWGKESPHPLHIDMTPLHTEKWRLTTLKATTLSSEVHKNLKSYRSPGHMGNMSQSLKILRSKA